MPRIVITGGPGANKTTLKYEREPGASGGVFFDCGALEGAGRLHVSAPLAAPELHALLARYVFDRPVFTLRAQRPMALP